MSEEQNTQHPKRSLFGRRKGRPLHKHKAALLETLLPQLQINLPETGLLDLPALFGATTRAYILEIGFGGGEHLAAQAAAHPDCGIIGCEPFLNGIASLLGHIDNQKLAHVRIFPNDARRLMDALPDACLARCFVLFPDPWPKKRHAERRFINAENMARFARVLKSGAELVFATDVMPLADWMEEHASAHPDFTQIYRSEERPADWIATRYEQKGLLAGRQPRYFYYRRR